MSFATVRRYIMLVLLVTFIAYFGVWQLYHAMLPTLGEIWSVVLATMASFGLGVIVVAGVIMVRTKSFLDAADIKQRDLF